MCHPSVNHDPDGRLNCRGSRRTYYMGGVLIAPEPPFAIQQIATAPMGVPDAYGETRQRQGWQVTFNQFFVRLVRRQQPDVYTITVIISFPPKTSSLLIL